MRAGIAVNKPKAVATRASEIPGATTVIDTCVNWARPPKAFIIPHTVPKRPIKGLTEATVERKESLFF